MKQMNVKELQRRVAALTGSTEPVQIISRNAVIGTYIPINIVHTKPEKEAVVHTKREKTTAVQVPGTPCRHRLVFCPVCHGS